jgi:hypothetical protein
MPEKYINDLESSSKRRKLLLGAGSLLTFIISVLFLGPFIHELSHITVLEFFNCGYSYNYGFSVFQGTYAQVTPYCSLPSWGSLGFYSSGYLVTMLVGGLFCAFSMKSDRRFRSYISASLGSGMLFSILLTIGSKGDLNNLARILEAESYILLSIVFVVTGIFVTTLRTLEHLFRLERKE